MTTVNKSDKGPRVIFGNHLRDGETMPPAHHEFRGRSSRSPEMLDDMGGDVIESGFPST